MKICVKCRETKAFDAFSKRAKSRDGLQGRCKTCDRNTNARWRAANVTHLHAYLTTNKDRKRASVAEWSAKNRERRRATIAAWTAANRERVRATNAAWSANNPEARAAIGCKRRARKIGATVEPMCPRALADLRNECAVLQLLTGERWVIDHIIPLARGGIHGASNLRPLPSRINGIKGARMDHEVNSEEFQAHINATGNSFELRITWEAT